MSLKVTVFGLAIVIYSAFATASPINEGSMWTIEGQIEKAAFERLDANGVDSKRLTQGSNSYRSEGQSPNDTIGDFYKLPDGTGIDFSIDHANFVTTEQATFDKEGNRVASICTTTLVGESKDGTVTVSITNETTGANLITPFKVKGGLTDVRNGNACGCGLMHLVQGGGCDVGP